MGSGEFFGELALIRQNSTRAADCIATQRTKVWRCACTFLERSLLAHPSAACRLQCTVLHRSRQLRWQTTGTLGGDSSSCLLMRQLL